MSRILLRALCLFSPLSVTGCVLVANTAIDSLPTPPEAQRWNFAWGDEFDGAKIDLGKWLIEGDGVRKKGYWNQNDAYLDGNGHLVLRTRRAGDRVYSGAISSRGKFQQRYGLWMIRCKFGTQQGHWPAFWLYSNAVQTVGNDGMDGTEIDVMEKPSLADSVHHYLHWDGYGESHTFDGREIEIDGISEGFHTFAVLWSETEYVFFVDGRETWRTNAGSVSQVPQSAWITDEVDDWAGDIELATLPDHFIVDWVRVYAAEKIAP
jgi:beta-glucanase (GH16 family)